LTISPRTVRPVHRVARSAEPAARPATSLAGTSAVAWLHRGPGTAAL